MSSQDLGQKCWSFSHNYKQLHDTIWNISWGKLLFPSNSWCSASILPFSKGSYSYSETLIWPCYWCIQKPLLEGHLSWGAIHNYFCIPLTLTYSPMPTKAGMGHAESGSPKLGLDFPHGWQVLKYLNYYLLFPTVQIAGRWGGSNGIGTQICTVRCGARIPIGIWKHWAKYLSLQRFFFTSLFYRFFLWSYS